MPIIPLGRIGMIQSFMYRAARIVMDTGMHAKGWSREQAIRYFTENVGLDEISATSEVERYVVWPGQACSYKIGHNEIVRLREEARARLGDALRPQVLPRRGAAERRHAARSAGRRSSRTGRAHARHDAEFISRPRDIGLGTANRAD